ncbi:ATP-binding cassette domain-containing protein [Nocardiopsis sp. NPDC007018]|uniref:ABC transporter ATP-binding protein n=1 Tax=Nocardiopsis sp. NPDC007018 TaxID=3155721 RepID=UPI0033F16EAD
MAPERYRREAVREVSMEVGYGELVGLLGPNGAGKSTTIKMLTGILSPTSGDLWVGGRVPSRNRMSNSREIGVVFGQRTQLWWDLPALDSLRVLRDVFEVEESTFRAQLRDLDDILELSPFWKTPVRHLSLGQRVRCDLAASMIHDPRIIFLDEPTIGMDVVVKQQVRELLLHQTRDRGRTVILTTHDMTEVERLTERIVLINRGRVVFDDTLHTLRERYAAAPRVRATLEAGAEKPAPPGAQLLSWDGQHAIFQVDRGRLARDVVRRLVNEYPVITVSVEDDLEELMRSVYLTAANEGTRA